MNRRGVQVQVRPMNKPTGGLRKTTSTSCQTARCRPMSVAVESRESDARSKHTTPNRIGISQNGSQRFSASLLVCLQQTKGGHSAFQRDVEVVSQVFFQFFNPEIIREITRQKVTLIAVIFTPNMSIETFNVYFLRCAPCPRTDIMNMCFEFNYPGQYNYIRLVHVYNAIGILQARPKDSKNDCV